MKHKKLTIFLLVLFVILFFGMLGNIVAVGNTTREFSEATTTEFAATVVSVRVHGEHVVIYSEEFGGRLSTHQIRNLSDISDFTDLKNGQTVFFRIENIWLEQLEEMLFFPIISIRTEEAEIVSLSSFTEQWADSRTTLRNTAIVFSLIFLSLAVFFAIRLKRSAS